MKNASIVLNTGKTVQKSFRFPPHQAQWLTEVADIQKVSQTKVIQNALQQQIDGIQSSKIADVHSMATGGQMSIEDDEMMNTLLALGVGSLSGIAGYNISKYIRKQMDLDQNKGFDMVMGCITGILGMVLTMKDKK